MSSTTAGFLLLATAYLIGSIPFGFLVAKLVRGIDIRQHGSGNIGATNVGRVLGGKWGIAVLVLDLLKGLLPVLTVAQFFQPALGAESEHWKVGAGIATIVGHMFPCWLGFKGGKGVATALGVVLCLAPWATLAAFLTFAVTFAIWRIVSLSSILASIGFTICQLAMLFPLLSQSDGASRGWSIAGFSILVPALIILRHRANIGRLLRGEEPRYKSGGNAGN